MYFDGIVSEIREMTDGDTGIIACVVIFRKDPDNGLEVLLTKRKSHPYKGEWSIPGGHVEKYETVEDAARREVEEETGLRISRLHLLDPWNPGYPEFGHNKSGATFWAVVKPTADVRPSSDAEDAKWVPVHSIPKMPFQDNARIHHAVLHAFGPHKTIESIFPSGSLLTEDKVDDQIDELLKARTDTESGLFIVFEGVDGVGKTTQTGKLVDWLESNKYSVETTKWNSSKLLADTIKKAKKKKLLTPIMYSILHAADMIVRYENELVPALENNGIVVTDRYVYTSYVRDKLRGIDTKLLDYVYDGMRKPDIVFYCVAPVRLAFERIMKEKGVPSYYAAGMDLGYSKSAEESAVKYAHACDLEYKTLMKKVPNVHTLDMNRSEDEIFSEVKKVLAEKFGIGRFKKY